jgi:hypothetical protein
MMTETHYDFAMDSPNPIDTLEAIAKENKWPLEKISDEEAALECEGRWGQFSLNFLWQEEFQALQFCCISTLKVPPMKLARLKELLFDINHKTWLGHFDLEHEDHTVVFRYTSLMRGFIADGQAHIEDLIDLAMTEFDRFYPAFKAILSERIIANDIMVTMLADPMGEA